jgi:ribosomal protein S18 acetylase RimI-like enzyme
MEIRRAAKEDAAAISTLNREIQALHAAGLPELFKPPAEDSFSAERVRTLLDTAGVRMWVAFVDNAPAGYLYAEVSRQGENALRKPHSYVYVTHICVAAAQRRRGIGRALLEAARAWALEEAVEGIQLDVWSFNADAQAFFARQGFAPLTLRMAKAVT